MKLWSMVGDFEEESISNESINETPEVINEDPLADIKEYRKVISLESQRLNDFSKRINKFKTILDTQVKNDSYVKSDVIHEINNLVDELKETYKDNKTITDIPSISFEKYRDFNDIKVATRKALLYLNDLREVVSNEEGGLFKSAGAFISKICSKISQLFESASDRALRLRGEVKSEYTGMNAGTVVSAGNLYKHMYTDGATIKFSEITKQANSAIALADPIKGYMINKTMEILEKYDKIGAFKPMAGEYNFANKFPVVLGYGSFRPGEGFAVDFLGGIWSPAGSKLEEFTLPKKDELVGLIEKTVTISSTSMKQIDGIMGRLYDYGSETEYETEYDWNSGKVKTKTKWRPQSSNQRYVTDTIWEIAICLYDILDKLMSTIFYITELCLKEDNKRISTEAAKVEVNKEISLVGKNANRKFNLGKGLLLEILDALLSTKPITKNWDIDELMRDMNTRRYSGHYAGYEATFDDISTLLYTRERTPSWQNLVRQYYDAEDILSTNNGVLLDHMLKCFSRRDFYLNRMFRPSQFMSIMLGCGRFVPSRDYLLGGYYVFTGNATRGIIMPTRGEYSRLSNELRVRYSEKLNISDKNRWDSIVSRFVSVNRYSLNNQDISVIREASDKLYSDAFNMEQRAFGSALLICCIMLEAEYS